MRRGIRHLVLWSVATTGLPFACAQEPSPATAPLYTTGNTGRAGSKQLAAVKPTSPEPHRVDPGWEGPSGGEAAPAPQIKLVLPPALPAVPTLRERIGWGANLGLVLVGYLGVLTGMRLLRQARGQLQAVEQLAQAAAQAAEAAAQHTHAAIDADRPWIKISVERSREAANTLQIVATNHGRSPAEIVDCPDKISVVKDEAAFQQDLWTEVGRSNVLKAPILLLPSESWVIQKFSRGDAKWVCQTEEKLAAVRRCEESIYIFGRVRYRSPHLRKEEHATDWCFRYIQGEGINDLVAGGPFDYNQHI